MQYFNKNVESVNLSSETAHSQSFADLTQALLDIFLYQKGEINPRNRVGYLTLAYKVEQDIALRNENCGLQDNYELCFCEVWNHSLNIHGNISPFLMSVGNL